MSERACPKRWQCLGKREFACLTLAAGLTLIPDSASPRMALGVGLGWQAMLRGGINIQPFSPYPSGAGGEQPLGVPLNELYKRKW